MYQIIIFLSTLTLTIQETPKILKYDFDNIGVGPYSFKYETSDGTAHNEEADVVHPNTKDEHLIIKGSYSFQGADGKIYRVDYTADNNGFHPEGDHFKVPPFVPWNHHHHDDQEKPIDHNTEESGNEIFAKKIFLPPTSKPFIGRTYIPSTPRPSGYNEIDSKRLRLN